GGGGAPVAPGPVATPTPLAQATPTPAPVATPDPSPTPPRPTDPCGGPVDRDTKPVRITVPLFVGEDPSGRVFHAQEDADGTPTPHVNFKFAVDAIAKDKKNKETRGSGNVIWHWDDNMIEIEKFDNVYHPTLRATRGGPWCATAELDEVMSNQLCLEFRY